MEKRGLRYYSKIMFKGSAAVSLAQATTKIVSLFILPVLTFYLTPEDYGTMSMVTLVVAFLNTLYNPGLTSATTRLYYIHEDIEERRDLIGSAYLFFLVAPLAVFFLSLIVGDGVFRLMFKDFRLYPYGLLAVALAFFGQPKRMWEHFMTLQYRVEKIAFYSVISVFLGMAASLLLVVGFKMGAMGSVLGMFPSALLIFFISFSTIHRFTRGRFSLASIMKQLRFGFPLIPAIWSYEILHLVDRLIIERLLNLNAVGIYTLGYQLSSIPMFFTLGFRQLWNPMFYENMNGKNYRVISNLISYYFLMLSLVCGGLILFSKEFIVLFISRRYLETIPVIPWVTFGVYFLGLLTISNAVLSYENRFKHISYIAFIAAVANIVLNFWMIPRWGITGSAAATFIAYFIYFALGICLSRSQLSQFFDVKRNLISAIFLVFAFASAMIFDDAVFRLHVLGIKIALGLGAVFLTYRLGFFSDKEIASMKRAILSVFRVKSKMA